MSEANDGESPPDTSLMNFTVKALETTAAELRAQVAELEKERDKAVAFATRMEKGEQRFEQLFNEEFRKIAALLGNEKKLDEGIGDTVTRAVKERDSLRSQLAAAKADGERLDWLSKSNVGRFVTFYDGVIHDVRAAIDAARGQTESS